MDREALAEAGMARLSADGPFCSNEASGFITFRAVESTNGGRAPRSFEMQLLRALV